MSKITKEMLIKALKFLDEPPPIPTLFYGGYLGLPLEWFPDVPDGGIFGPFRHVKIKRLSVNDL